MTFEDREKEIFFDIISDLTGHHDPNNQVIEIGLTKSQIVKRAGERITPQKADFLFGQFNGKYLDEQMEQVYKISASGRVFYWEYLKKEAEKSELDKKSVRSTIKTVTTHKMGETDK